MWKTTITPRIGESDFLGHVNNITCAGWFELARHPVFTLFSPHGFVKEDWHLIMAHSEYDFVSEITLGRDVEVRTWIERIGNTSFTVRHEAWQNEKLCVRGAVVLVYYDFVKKTPLSLPPEKRAALEEYLHG